MNKIISLWDKMIKTNWSRRTILILLTPVILIAWWVSRIIDFLFHEDIRELYNECWKDRKNK